LTRRILRFTSQSPWRTPLLAERSAGVTEGSDEEDKDGESAAPPMTPAALNAPIRTAIAVRSPPTAVITPGAVTQNERDPSPLSFLSSGTAMEGRLPLSPETH
jgi:hypothetical protein